MAAFLGCDVASGVASALHYAIRTGQCEYVEIWIETFLDPSTIIYEYDLLHLAVSYNHTELAKLLLTRFNYPVDCRNRKNQTPLHIACCSGYLNMVKMLLTEYEAKLVLDDEIINDTPLHEAARCGQTEVVGCLINEFSCDPSARGLGGKTILHYACHQGNPELVEMLLTQYELEAQIMSTDNDGNIPLHHAAMSGNETILRSLITKYKCPVEFKNHSDQTPLHFACANGHVEIVKVLVIEYNADINAHDEYRHTPLHKAALLGQSKVVVCLINELSCDPNTKGIDGKTILHTACYQGYTELVETLLIQYGPDLLSISDDNGNTPLHYAAFGGNERLAQLLVTKYNCPLTCENNNKESSFHIAFNEGHFGFVKLIVNEFKADLIHSGLYMAGWFVQIDAMNSLIYNLSISPHIVKFKHVHNEPSNQNYSEEIYESAPSKSFWASSSLAQLYDQSPLSSVDKKAVLLLTKYDSKKSHSSIIRIFTIEYKAEINPHKENSKLSLYEGVWYGNTQIIESLISEFCNIPTISEGIDRRTMLNLVSQQGYIELVNNLLMQYRINPLPVDSNGNSPLHHAAWGDRKDIVQLLITKHNCSVNVKNNNNQTPLHLVCSAGHISIVRELVEQKAELYIQDNDNNMPLHIAARYGHETIVQCLIDEFKCNSNIKGSEGRTILHYTCHQGYFSLVERLLINYNLDPMALDDGGNIPLHYASLSGKREIVDMLITKYGCSVNHQNNNGETPLHLASRMGNLTLTRTLIIQYKANLKMYSKTNDTPLQEAALHGKAAVVNCLIEEFGCDKKITGTRERNLLHYACLNGYDMLARLLIDSFDLSPISTDSDGNSPLHLSAMHGQNKCVHMLLHAYDAPVYLRNNSGKTALEVVRGVGTKKIIDMYLKEKRSKIQDDYRIVQRLSSKKYSGAQRLTRVFVLGNVQSGKSTLVESLKRRNFFSSFSQVTEAEVPPHTSGIVPSEYSHKSIGRVVYYDFAGDPEYHSSHSAIMSRVMQSEGATNVCLILVNLKKDGKNILEELGYWFSFISYHCTKLKVKSKVLVIGSHVDLITKHEARRKVTLVSELTKKYLSQASRVSFDIVNSKGSGDLIINCCNPRSSTPVYNTLKEVVRRAETFRLSGEAAILLGLLEKDFNNVVTCKIHTLLTHIMQTGVYLPNTADTLYPKVMELHTVGLLMIIECKSGKLWDYLLLLNVPKLTNEVHKLLFSKDSAKKSVSSTDLCSASMGILPQTYLSSILPEYITTECLIQLQYCQEFNHAEVKFDFSIISTEDSNAPTLLYFPALCETERKKCIKTPEDYIYSISWYLKCGEMFDYFPPRFLHVLLLRLAHSFALPTAYDPSSMNGYDTTLRLYNRRCTMWKNGIHWLMEEGVECYIENVNNSKGVVVIVKSEEAHKSTCTEMLFNIIREVHQAKEEFCETVTLQEYLMDSDDPTTFTDEDKLFSACDIARVLQEGKPYIVSAGGQGHTQLKATKISHLFKYVHWGKYHALLVL